MGKKSDHSKKSTADISNKKIPAFLPGHKTNWVLRENPL
jgi:hypothetical protein